MTRIAATVVAILMLVLQPAAAKPFPNLWVFGDSTVDTGWYKKTPHSGIHKFDIYLADPTLGVGKPTNNNGPMSVEVLAGVLGVEADPANRRVGTNYATSGARNVEVNLPGSGFFPNAVPTTQQIKTFIADRKLPLLKPGKPLHPLASNNDLHVISSGHNDVDFAVNHLQGRGDNPEGYVADAAEKLAAQIHQLQKTGAKYIIVANLFESFGSALKKHYRVIYNAALKGKLDLLGVKYASGDINAVRIKMETDPLEFGLNYIGPGPAERACSDPMTGPDPALAIDAAWALLCSPMSPVSQPWMPKANEAQFADDSHFATGGQRVIGGYYYCLARNTWPLVFKLATVLDPTAKPPRRPPFVCTKFFPRSPTPTL